MLKFMEQSRSKSASKIEQWLENIPIDLIRPNPHQPRRTFNDESIDELCRSIAQVGLINPISVRKVGTTYELIAGERRLRASRRAGLSTIKAIVVSVYEQDSALIAMVENLQRENLHFLEEAEGYQSLLRNHNMTQEELASKIGKNQSTVANRLRLLRLPLSVRNAIVAGKLTERHARALLRIPEESMQLKLITVIRNMKLSVAATEDLVQKTLNNMFETEPDEPQKRITAVFRDSRLLVNSIKKAVAAMSESGIDASMEINEKGSTAQIVITLPWRSNAV
ncbi:MAG: ParB/RepB/Spo0J family partition protein [Christensenellales bacterium]|jgi:ParB family chromosome partitioning protein